MGYTVAYMKTEWLRKRASREDLDALQSLAKKLGLDASSALWFVVREKLRELDQQSQPRGTAGKKSRRSAA